jgi:origin recognition complex subunit 6
MPVIRQLCKEFEHPAAAPHVFVGIDSLLPRLSAEAPDTPTRRRPRRGAEAQAQEQMSDLRLLALIAVLFFYTLARMLDVAISPEEYILWRRRAMALLLTTSVGQEYGKKDLFNEIEGLMPMVKEQGWDTMEWYTNITPRGDTEDMEGVEMTGSKAPEAGSTNGGLKGEYGSSYIGLATMMQDAVDFLGERRRADYAVWKAEVLAACDEIEAS